jgi:hypothetical protein
MQENDSCRKVIYMANVQGPEKVNNTCVKTMRMGKWIEVSLHHIIDIYNKLYTARSYYIVALVTYSASSVSSEFHMSG